MDGGWNDPGGLVRSTTVAKNATISTVPINRKPFMALPSLLYASTIGIITFLCLIVNDKIHQPLRYKDDFFDSRGQPLGNRLFCRDTNVIFGSINRCCDL